MNTSAARLTMPMATSPAPMLPPSYSSVAVASAKPKRHVSVIAKDESNELRSSSSSSYCFFNTDSARICYGVSKRKNAFRTAQNIK